MQLTWIELAQVRPSDAQLSEGMAPQKVDQRYEIRLMIKEGTPVREVIARMQNLHGNNCLSVSSIRRWCAWFQSGQDRIQNLPKTGAPKKRNAKKVAEIRALVTQDRRSSIREISRQVGLSFGCVQKSLHKDLQLKKRSARWIPHLLTPDQKVRRVAQARAALQQIRSRTRPIDRVVAQDESWMFTWDPAKKEATKEWLRADEPRPVKPRIERSTVKTMLVGFIDRQGVIHREFVPDGHGISSEVYIQILGRFQEALKKSRPGLARSGRWTLLQDGAPAHTACPTRRWLGDHNITTLPHPGYLPDLNPMDYWFFDKLKAAVRGVRYQRVEDLHGAIDAAIKLIPAQEFGTAMDKLPQRLRQCIDNQGAYFIEHGH